MRNFFFGFAAIFFFIAFVFPVFFVFSFFSFVFAIGSSPPGLRPDGKRRTGGLLGGIIDNHQINATMHECNYCKEMIPNNAKKCKYCGEWSEKKETEYKTGIIYCPSCNLKNRALDQNCYQCGYPLF